MIDQAKVLVASLTSFAIVCILIVFWAQQFDKILSFSIFLDCFGMALSAGSIFILRKRTAHLDKSTIYVMKLYPLLPILFISAYVFVGISILIDKPSTALTGLGVLGLFIAIYFLTRKRDLDPPPIPG